MKPWEKYRDNTSVKPWEKYGNTNQQQPQTITKEDLAEKYGADALAQIKANNANYNTMTDRLKNILKGGVNFATGTAEGINSGVDSVLNGATFGFYDKLNPEAKDRREKLQQRAESVGLGGVNKFAQGTAEFGGMGLNPLNYIGGGYISKGASALNKAARAAGVGGLIGGVAGASGAESLEELPQNILSGVGIGSAMGGALPLAGAAVKGLGKIGKFALSKTTGAGAEAINRAYNAGIRRSKVFLDNMRGKAPAESVVAQAKNEISGMVEGNSDLYRANMEKAFSDNTKLDISKIMDKFREISGKTTAGGMKSARGEEKKVLKEIKEYLKPYLKNKELHTTQWLDDLRQDIYSIKTDAGTKANRLKKQMENIIKDTISEQRPEYREGLKTFAKNKAEIEELQRVFSLNDKASIDTALRKIQSLGRNNVQTNYGYRNALMDKLDFSGNIRDAAAGQLLNTWMPRGLQAGAAGGINIYSAVMNPALLPEAMTYAAASSPRVVGELAYGLGRMSTKLPSGNITPYLAQYIADHQ